MRLKIAVFSILSSCLAIFLLDLWLEAYGLPPRLRERLVSELTVDGLDIDYGQVHAGVARGIILNDVRIALSEEKENPLAQVQQAQLTLDLRRLIEGKVEWSLVRLYGVTLEVPLETSGGRKQVVVKNIHLTLTNREEEIDLESNGVCGGLRLRVEGRLHKPETSKPFSEAMVRDALEQIRQGFTCLAPAVRNHVDEAVQVCSELPSGLSTLELHLQVPMAYPTLSRGEAQMELRQLQWRGLAVDRLALRAALTPERLELSDIRLVLDEQESIQGSAVLSRTDSLVNIDLSARLFPARLLKIASSKLLSSPYYPRFEGAPPFWMLEVHQSPLMDLEKWDVHGYVEVKDVIVQEGRVTSGRGTVAYKDRLLKVDDLRVVLADRTVATADLRYGIDDDRLTLNAMVDGMPQSVVNITGSPELKQLSHLAFGWFEWQSDAPPHFELTFSRYHHGDKVAAMVLASARMRGFKFRGQAMDAARMNVLLDGTNHELVLNDIRLVRNGRIAKGALAYTFSHDQQSIRYELDSYLEPDVLLGLTHPPWKQKFMNWQIMTDKGVHLESNGWINLENITRSRAAFSVSTPLVSHDDLDARSALGRLRYHDGRLSGEVSLGTVQSDKWKATLLTSEIDTDFAQLAATGTIDTVECQGTKADDVKFDLKLADGIVTGKASSGRGTLERPAHQTFSYRNAQAKNLKVDGSDIQADVQVDEVTGPDIDVVTIASKLDMHSGVAMLEGRTGAIHLPNKAKAADSTFRATGGGGNPWAVTLDVPEIVLSDDLRILGLTGKLTEKGRGIHGVLRAKSAKLRERLEMRDVLTDLTIHGALMEFRANAGMLRAGGIRLQDVTCSGNGSAGTVIAEMSSSRGSLLDFYDLQQVRSSMTYQESRLSFNYLNALAFGGKVNGNLQIDIDRESGQAYFVVDGLHLENLPQTQQMKSADRITGLLSGQASVTFQGVSSDIQLFGNGELKIRDGQVYRLPVLASFLELVDKVKVLSPFITATEFGSITAMDSTIRFEGDRIDFDQIKTNGSLLALGGKGYYWWKTRGLDFRIQGQLLKKIIPLTFTSPFRIFLDRRAVGSLGNINWESLSVVRDVFRDAETPMDPTTTRNK